MLLFPGISKMEWKMETGKKKKMIEGAVEFHSYHFICLAPMMLFALLTSHSDPAQPVGFEEAAVCHQHSRRHSASPKGVLIRNRHTNPSIHVATSLVCWR